MIEKFPRAVSRFGTNWTHYKSKSWSKPRKHLNISASLNLVDSHCAMAQECFELTPKPPKKRRKKNLNFVSLILFWHIFKRWVPKKLCSVHMSSGKSNIQVIIPLNLPYSSYILTVKFSRFLNNGQSTGLQSPVVQEYMSKISEFGYFEARQHSMRRNCVLPLSL